MGRNRSKGHGMFRTERILICSRSVRYVLVTVRLYETNPKNGFESVIFPRRPHRSPTPIPVLPLFGCSRVYSTHQKPRVSSPNRFDGTLNPVTRRPPRSRVNREERQEAPLRTRARGIRPGRRRRVRGGTRRSTRRGASPVRRREVDGDRSRATRSSRRCRRL